MKDGILYYEATTGRLRVKRDGHNIIRREKIPKPVVLVDTREKDPLPLRESHPNWIQAERRATLKTGDYTIEGMEGILVLERKSLSDLVACTVTYRQRFLAACARLSGFVWKAILVEATLEDIRAASSGLTFPRMSTRTPFAAPWTPSRPSSAFPSSMLQRCGSFPGTGRQLAFQALHLLVAGTARALPGARRFG
ncbi:MAG: hypothetical protein WCZ16_15095 [Desulfosarcinaceae bacterium]